MPREVLVEYRKGPKKGQYGIVKSAAVAKKEHPDATIVSFWPTNEPYSEKQDTKAAEHESMPAVAAAEKSIEKKD